MDKNTILKLLIGVEVFIIALLIIFILQKPVEAYAAGYGDQSSEFYNMTDEEYNLLSRIVALEALDEGYEGQVAVVEIIFNRVNSKRWPNTVKGVIMQKGQFETVRYLNKPYCQPDQTTYAAIDQVIENGRTIIPGSKYCYFCTHNTATRGVTYDFKLGGHKFGYE